MAARASRRRSTALTEGDESPFPKITNDAGEEVIPVVRHMRAVTVPLKVAEKIRESYTETDKEGEVRVMLTNTNVRHLWNDLSASDKKVLLDPDHPSGKGPLVRLDAVPGEPVRHVLPPQE